MSEQVMNRNFENVIIEAFAVPPVSEEFVNSLYAQIIQQDEDRKTRQFFSKPMLFRFALIMLALFLAVFLIIGPQKVYAAIMRLFGYIPGVGVVTEDTDIRILAEPVSVTRDGITFSVNSMVLTPNESIVDFGTMGVPGWASANEGLDPGCMEFPYLMLDDSTQINVVGKEAVPPDVWDAIFVVPCIFGAYADLTPTDWQIPVTFVPAPDDFVVLPVQDVSPEVLEPTLAATELMPTEEAIKESARVTIEKMIETENGYILIGKIIPTNPGDTIQQMGTKVIKDANGNTIPLPLPANINTYELMDMEQGEVAFANEFSGSGVVFPITLEVPGVVVTTSPADEKTQMVLSVPAEAQVGEIYNVQQVINLSGHELILETIQKSEYGYKFGFRTLDDVVGVAVDIEGYTSLGGGGGWVVDGTFTRSLQFEQLPVGDLTLTFFGLQVSTEPQIWTVSWAPQEAREFSAPTLPDDLCWHSIMGNPIPVLNGQLQGSVMVTQYLDQPQTLVYGMDGELVQTFSNASRAAYAADGQHMAYQMGDLFKVLSIASGEEKSYTGYSVRDITWSPDGRQIAFVNNGEHSGIFLLDLENGQSRQLTDYGYEYIAGWSVDGNTLYYSIPGASEDGFPLFELDVISGESGQLFLMENSSLKAPYPRISPDNQWLTYRDRNGSSLYLKSMDGGTARLVMENAGQAIGNANWSVNGDWLALNVYGADMTKPDVVLIDPFTCEMYKVPGIWGEVNGVIVE